MQVIKSIVTTDEILLSSNILEDEAPEWKPNKTYNVGDKVIYDHKVYEAILKIENTEVRPPPQDQKNWLFVEVTNRYKMFDNVISDASSNPNTIEVVLQPNELVGGVVLLGLQGASVTLVIDDDIFGEVYRETVLLSDFNSISDYFSYFNAPSYGHKTSAAFMELPQIPTARIKVIVDAGSGIAKIGEMIYGLQKLIGRTNYGTAIGIKSFSRKDTDEFGNVTVVKRKNSKYAEYDVDIDNYMLADVQRFFADIDSIPCVFIGNESMDELIVYGFYSDFKAIISFPSVSKCTLRVEGLV